MRISDWSSDVCSSDLPAQIGHRLDAQLCRRARAQFRQRVAEAFDVVVTEKSAMDDDAGDVALAQYAHQFVGAAQRADRNGDGADAGDRGEHQRKVRTAAVDEADATAFANAARVQPRSAETTSELTAL